MYSEHVSVYSYVVICVIDSLTHPATDNLLIQWALPLPLVKKVVGKIAPVAELHNSAYHEVTVG